MSVIRKVMGVTCVTKLGLVQWGQPLSKALGSTRNFSLSPMQSKNYKFKPLPPKRTTTEPEDLFGQPKGWNIPSGGYFLLVSLGQRLTC